MSATGDVISASGRPLGGGTILVEGGYPLRGTVAVGGSKNAGLPILAAALLTDEPCTIRNLPDIEDIYTMLDVLRALGAEVDHRPGEHMVTVRAVRLVRDEVPRDLGTRMRASFLAVGPLLARLGRAIAPHPGGCDIGMRPVNVDVRGFQAMGARVVQEADPDGEADPRGYDRKVRYAIEAPRLRGTRLYLDYPSHTGTENLLLAACRAEGTTIIRHASMEPEVGDLANFLRAMGARIKGIGTSTLEIEGVERLHGADYRLIPDRLAAGTFLIAGVISGGEVRTVDVVPEHLEPVTYKLAEAGARVDEGPDWVSAAANGALEGVDVQAIHYPGFPTDLQAAFAALLTQAQGKSVIHERVFENRLEYAADLRNLGADIEVDASGQRATILGARRLRGAPLVYARDIRSGAAVVLAALAAHDRPTMIIHAYHLDRGYEDLVGTLARLGARIRRLNSAEAAEELVRVPAWPE
ncbi:MAG TPA: UDP-N-acetylglucosamine 1-carboxyvinyltransferase [Chloroflexota bacterium]|nr:UDP-N-acetylglucosamine 1-carboxyvinyltransferase [Chloroflexota bacterium]